MNHVILDISRLISRVRHATPSGVDRVEMAYARGLLARYGDNLAFAAVHPSGLSGLLNRATAMAYLDELEQRWAKDQGGARPRSLLSVLPWMIRLLPGRRRRSHSGTRAVYVQVSPHHLTNARKVDQMIRWLDARLLCMVHDLIPLEYPEYARPNGAALHQRRIETVTKLADAVIVNSAATARSLQPWLERSGRTVPVHVALLGTEDMGAAATQAAESGQPYFVCLSTIEGRKNHLLLLHVWRQLASRHPAEQLPRLVIIGRRGWENEQVLDLLDRSPALVGLVEEVPACPDSRLRALLCGARALLMPSFAEGFGMPVAEALSLGVPVICSDLPAHREVGGLAPDYLDPLDGPGWTDLILDFARQGDAWRAQTARLKTWTKPTWENHFAIIARAIADLGAAERVNKG